MVADANVSIKTKYVATTKVVLMIHNKKTNNYQYLKSSFLTKWISLGNANTDVATA